MDQKWKKYLLYGTIILVLLIAIPAVNIFQLFQSGRIFVHEKTQEFGIYRLAFHWRTGPVLVLTHLEYIDWGIKLPFVDGHVSVFGSTPVDYGQVHREAYQQQNPEICEAIVFCGQLRESCLRLTFEHGLRATTDSCNEKL